MITKFSVRLRPAFRASGGLLDRMGLEGVEVIRDYYIESDGPPTPKQVEQLRQALGHPITEMVEVNVPLSEGQMVQISHRRGIVDNESESLVELCRLFGIPARAGKLAHTYASEHPGLLAAIHKFRFNPHIEEVHTTEPAYETLRPLGFHLPSDQFDLCGLTDQQLADIGRANGRNLNLAQMRQTQKIQRATGTGSVSDVLLEALDARWSDHCYHTTWKSLGNLLGVLVRAAERAANPNVLSMFHDNAGVWDFYHGYGVALKAETHNGPSAISAYFGQLTKLGGVLRDILGTGLGADPIGVFEYTATGPVEALTLFPDRPAPRQIANETIRAIKEYGNTFGTPMMAARMAFHPRYRAKPFALGGCIGLVPHAAARRGQPVPGDLLVLIGGLTGNEGIHGASASSAGSVMDVAAVQIGSPLEQVKFRQAIIDLRDAGCLRALTDVGGAGLNSAVGEIGEVCGVTLNTALVPLKTAGLPMWRILLSESQERMVLAVIAKKLEVARTILRWHDVRATVVGRFTATERYCVYHDPAQAEADICSHDPSAPSGELGFDIPYDLLRYDPPPLTPGPLPELSLVRSEWPAFTPEELADVAPRVAAAPEVCDQSFAGSQYDSTVQGNTIYGPYTGGPQKVPTSYWAATPLPGQLCAVVFSTSFNPWLFEAHPVRALRQGFLGLLGTQLLAGVRLTDVCLCDNFYTPHLEPGAYAWLSAMVHELGALIETFGTPVISGKDSSAGSTRTSEGVISVPPAVYFSGLGKVPDVGRLRRNDWRAAGNLLVRIGPDCDSLAGTVAARVLGLEANDVDILDTAAYLEYLRALESLPEDLVLSGCPIGSGGVLGGVFLRALAGEIGVALRTTDGGPSGLLREHRCGAVVEVALGRLGDIPAALRPRVVGELVARPGSVTLEGQELLTPAVVERWKTAFQEALQ